MKGKAKGKVPPITGHEGAEGEKSYSCTLSLSSAQDGGGCSTYAPAALPPGKNGYPLYRRLGGPKGRSGQVRKISPLPAFDPRTVQPVASRYTVYAIPDPFNCKVKCTLVQALRLCTGRTAHRGSRGIALLFHDQWH